MKRKALPLAVVNIIVALSIGSLMCFVISRLFGGPGPDHDDKSIVAINVGIGLGFFTTFVVAILFYSTAKLFKGIYKKRLQIFAAALVMFFVCAIDALFHKHFSEISIAEKVTIIYLNVIAMMEMIGSVFTALIWDKQFSSDL
jgi:hypothetical protein